MDVAAQKKCFETMQKLTLQMKIPILPPNFGSSCLAQVRFVQLLVFLSCESRSTIMESTTLKPHSFFFFSDREECINQ